MEKIPALLLDPEQFQAWKEHPVTAEFLRFLKDRQRGLMEAWGRGVALCPEQQAQAVLLGQLAGISSAEVAEHYNVETGGPDNG